METYRNFNLLISRVSKALKKDPRLVQSVARHQFRFIARNVIADPNHEKSYRARFWGLFAPKPIINKENIKEL